MNTILFLFRLQLFLYLKLIVLSSRYEKDKEVYFIIFLQYTLRSSPSNQANERNKEPQTAKEKAKWSLFEDDMIFYVQNSNKLIKTIRINKLIQQVYKLQGLYTKSVCMLYSKGKTQIRKVFINCKNN